MKAKTGIFPLALVLIAFASGESDSNYRLKGPETFGRNPATNFHDDQNLKELDSEHRIPGPVHYITLPLLNFYRSVISPAKGFHCPSYPSCSSYAKEAFSRYNPLWAFWLTSDRLNRCGHDRSDYPIVWVDDAPKLYDPVPPMISLSVLLLTAAFSAGPDSAASGESFASYLHGEGEYYRAITEYLRMLHEHPQDPKVVEWQTDIVACYAEAGETDEALRWAGRWVHPNQRLSHDESQLAIYPVDLALKADHFDFILGIQARHLQLEDSSTASQLDRGYAIALASTGKSGEAVTLAKSHPDWDPRFLTDLENTRDIPHKSPALGTLFSVFPGGGYLYAGKPATALASFAIISLLGLGMYESIRNDQTALAVGLGIFNLAWYTGSISVSARLVDDWNQRKYRVITANLHQYF